MVQQLQTPTSDEAPVQVETYWPEAPRSIGQMGLPPEFLGELLLKTLYVGGPASLEELSDRLGTGFDLVEELTAQLKREQSIEPVGASGYSEWGIRYRLTARGSGLAESALERSRYVGRAPVTLQEYTDMAKRQSPRRNPPTRGVLQEAFEPFILRADVKDSLARIFFSGRTVLIFGDSGNGKTSIVESYARAFGGAVLFPYALYVGGQVIRIYDPVRHVLLPMETPEMEAESTSLLRGSHMGTPDRRWVKIRRPVIAVGGELDSRDLDLAFDAQTRQYQAPAHLKSQNGIFLIDDFGRQRARPEEILNRWVVPMESGTDTLTLQTGETFTIPFEMALIFSSNLRPHDLADEAFLRRIPYKIRLPGPDRGEFAQITAMWCRRLGIAFADDAIAYLTERVFGDPAVLPRASHPRDLGLLIVDYARYDDTSPVLSREYADKACTAYFLEDT